jgi:hypothetical protein
VPQTAILGPIKIINGQCNMLPRITNPTFSDLLAHWGSCQNMAYDVNFVMHTAPRPQFGADGGGTITPAGSDTQRGMLSNSPQQGMLAAAGSPTQLQSSTGGLLGNKRSAPLASATATPASKVELNPQPLPPRTTTGVGGVSMGMKAAVTPQRTILSPGCTVSQLQLRFRTGNDDLRGGQNNLNVEVHFADGTMQVAKNVNHGANWGNNSTNIVTVSLKQPVAPSQIKQIGLVQSAQGGYIAPNSRQGAAMATPAGPVLAPIYAAQGVQSEDNWDMAELQAFALGPNHTNVPIASFGMHRFTGSDPALEVNARPDVGCSDANEVRKITLTFQTGNDDLRGGNDNLNVILHFADGTTQFEPNVNHSERWADGSTHGAEVLLNQPVPMDQITAVTLATTFQGGPGGDNWNMDSVQITADDTRPLARYGFYRFSADWSGPKAKELTIPLK